MSVSDADFTMIADVSQAGFALCALTAYCCHDSKDFVFHD